MKIILTGSTGFVGEGVLLECLQNPKVTKILMVNRRHNPLSHSKLKQLIVPDFNNLEQYAHQLRGYDACFYCAGISSVGVSEKEYTAITYDLTMLFADVLLKVNPAITFGYITGKSTDATEKGKGMWQRIKGKTENALLQKSFKAVYCFRPGFMKPTNGQKNVGLHKKIFSFFWPTLFPSQSLIMKEVGLAMINASFYGYSQKILTVKDMKSVSKLS
jgi:hypothetical protein